ncbi:hypothetical protein KP509_23G062000 [Ceratopteris richardii]|uniref:CCHC-type domain-containing protein n=1 Tax=Ceratopteris richardii TaxID=49495 RepID=A0A8T2S2F2_CERRI|nr:hypothetical protein KP509_23G062000 [Ceratopteris richardii]
MFHERGLLLFFTTRIPVEVDVANAINASVEKEVVDKVLFYSGHGLFEVILNDNAVKLQFLEQQTIFLCGLMAHVFPWKPVKAMKEELLYKCPVWVELIDLPSFLWTSIGQVAKVLGKILYTPSISAPNKNRICIMWNTSRPFPRTLGINVPNVGRIVIYLKWGSMAGSCFHCGDLGHYSKNCPTLKSDGVNLIPACPGSKILVPEEQVFGRQRNMQNSRNSDAVRPPPPQGIGNKGKEIAIEKHLHPITPTTPIKLNVYKRREGEDVAKIPLRKNGEEAGKRAVDNDGFTPVSYKKALLRGKRSKFQSGFSPSVGSLGFFAYCPIHSMKIATWNIQGLGQYGKWTRLWRWIVRPQLDVVAIQEHKKHDHAGMRLHTRDFQLCYNGLKNAYSGCLFIIRKDIPYQVLFDDPQGRFLIVHILLCGIPYICINVYAPNSPAERAKTWENIMQAIRSCERLHLWENTCIIMCGDFNMVETESDCTTVPSLISSREKWLWNEILDSLKCKDLWGFIGGHTIRYTFHSRSHRKAMSRLDRCYYSHISTLSHTSKMWIDATMLLSDHSPLLMLLIDSDWTANIPGKFHRIPLRVDHAWMQTAMFKSKVDNLIQQVLALKLSASLKWEAMVLGMQDVIRDCGKHFSKVLKAAKDEAKHVILSLTERVDMGHFLSHKDYSRLCDAYRCLQFVENKAIESAKVRARCMDVNDLHASSRCFFDFLRAKRAANTISSLHFGDKELRDGNSIADVCSSHFGNLFAASYSTDDSWFTALHQAATLKKLGFGLKFCRLIYLLSQDSTSQVEINGRLSTPFPVQRSVRQGCPLSPLFYAMASTPMFYLLQAKLESGFIHGISLHGSQHIALGFADDTFIFAKACEENIQRTLASLASFSEASALSINMGKSALINISARHFQFSSKGVKLSVGSFSDIWGIH